MEKIYNFLTDESSNLFFSSIMRTEKNIDIKGLPVEQIKSNRQQV